MACNIYYSIIKEGFPYWPQLGGSVALAVVGGIILALLIFAFKRGPAVMLYRAGAAIFTGVWIWIGLSIALQSYSRYVNVSEVFLKGAAQTVEGQVTSFHAAPSLGTRIEQFSVGNVTFAYSPNALQPGFRQTRAEGNPIRDGDNVRIWYVGDVIVQLELCKTASGH